MSKTPPSLPQNDDLKGWAEAHLNEDHPYLLAFADDGVIWGKLAQNALVTSNAIDDEISPILHKDTLQQASVFGKESEIRLFKTEDRKWKVIEITDTADIIKESQILWGSRALESDGEFTQVFDARQQGLDHIVPLNIENSVLDPDEGGTQCIRLDVHHFVGYNDKTGEARIVASRLAGLRVGKKNEEVE